MSKDIINERSEAAKQIIKQITNPKPHYTFCKACHRLISTNDYNAVKKLVKSSLYLSGKCNECLTLADIENEANRYLEYFKQRRIGEYQFKQRIKVLEQLIKERGFAYDLTPFIKAGLKIEAAQNIRRIKRQLKALDKKERDKIINWLNKLRGYKKNENRRS